MFSLPGARSPTARLFIADQAIYGTIVPALGATHCFSKFFPYVERDLNERLAYHGLGVSIGF